jgi:tRNA (guanine37-N1)-methyltransferase
MKASGLKRIDFVTLFPAMFEGPMTQSLLGRARKNGLLDIRVHNLRDYSADTRHHKVDDRPYGGGAGMVIQAEPIFKALQKIRSMKSKVLLKKHKPHVIYLSPQGNVLTQKRAQKLAQMPWVVMLCGHYEGLDERIMRSIDEEISIGDYVLTGGELPAMVVADAMMRWVPGVVKEADSIANDSFQNGLLDYPHYTRPALWRGQRVPAVLLSGHHEQIQTWRAKQSQQVTAKKRPDLLRR